MNSMCEDKKHQINAQEQSVQKIDEFASELAELFSQLISENSHTANHTVK